MQRLANSVTTPHPLLVCFIPVYFVKTRCNKCQSWASANLQWGLQLPKTSKTVKINSLQCLQIDTFTFTLGPFSNEKKKKNLSIVFIGSSRFEGLKAMNLAARGIDARLRNSQSTRGGCSHLQENSPGAREGRSRKGPQI